MLIHTRNFGELEIKQEEIIMFQDGIPGFEKLTQYVIIKNPEEEIPFHWLQSVEDPQLAFVIINPFLFKKDYDFQIPKSIVERLEINAPESLLIYAIVVIPNDINQMTANLMAPIIINQENNRGKQVVLEGQQYHTKHLILEEIKQVG